MNIFDPVKAMASTVADKATEASLIVAHAVHTVATSTINAVENLTGMDLNGDDIIGENSAKRHDKELVSELPKHNKTTNSQDHWI